MLLFVWKITDFIWIDIELIYLYNLYPHVFIVYIFSLLMAFDVISYHNQSHYIKKNYYYIFKAMIII